MPTTPDILFIVLDTLRRDRLTAYGYERETSPVFDSISQESTLFERAISPAQWTVPAHGSLFTGLYPGTHGLTQAYHQLSGHYPTLAEILQMADYHTVAFCNNPMLGNLETGLQRGFDHFFNYTGATPERPVDMQRTAVRRLLATRIRRIARYITNRFAHSDFLFRMSMFPVFVRMWSNLLNFKGNTARSLDDVMDYWQQYHAGGKQKPLFTFINLMGTHMPYHPPQAYLRQMAPDLHNDKQAFKFMTHHNADGTGWLSPTDPPLTDWQRRTLAGFYDAEIRHQDEHLGRLFDWLRRSGKLDETLVIITADHGEGHGDHNFMGHSFVVYQELVHVPLLIRFPGLFPAGRRIQTNVSTRRLYHTILDFAGLEPPLDEADPNRAVESLSLVQSLNGRPDTEGNMAFSEAFPPDNLLSVLEYRRPDLIQRLNLRDIRRGVYQGDHKLAVVGDQVESLFDVDADPAEQQNLASQQRDVVHSLQSHLGEFVQQTTTGTDQYHQGDLSDDVVENLRALGYFE